jgi:hypothetical protein
MVLFTIQKDVEFLICGTLNVKFEYDNYFCKTLCSLLNHYISLVIDNIKDIFGLLSFIYFYMLSN